MSNFESSRREFLRNAAMAAGGAALALNISEVLAAGAAAAAHDGQQWQVLTHAEAAGLAAFADQVYPPGDSPGASQIGAVRFMDVALGGFMAGALPMVQDGLADLDNRALKAGGSSFAALPFEQQTAIMEAIEKTPFFGNAHFMTLCGLFALPAQGGNIDRAGWAELGYESRHAWQPPFGYYDAQYAMAGDNHGV
jgi:hypothetical protein